MQLSDLYLVMVFLFFAGVVSAILVKKEQQVNYLAHGLSALGCIAAVLCALFVLFNGTQHVLSLPLYASLSPITADIDSLSAYFLLIIGLVGGAVSIYACAYSTEYYGLRFSIMTAILNAFLLSMVLVVTLSHIIGFLISWELMAILSFFLVNHDYDKEKNRRAAYVYLVMTHIGTAFIIIAFLLLASISGSLEFDSLTNLTISPQTKNMIFICALIGFGTKAGVVPLHVWLPRAHPVVPSHVSALMSGVMIKTAIYGMCRFFLFFLGPGPLWWGGVILILAIASALLGILYALMESDLKKLLAYSSVENIGIILFGIGAGMIFMSKGHSLLAGLAWSAALFHVFNHAIFKSLLFMVSGAIHFTAHTMNIEKMGGLIKVMPYTAWAFLTGAAAISALPPLNGFIGEWLAFQALLFLPQALNGVIGKLASAVLIAILGLTGALAAACFVKAFGISFLAKPRSSQAENAQEVPTLMRIAMGCMAAICIAVGVYPQFMFIILEKVFANAASLTVQNLFNNEWYFISFKADVNYGLVSTQTIFLLLFLSLISAFLLFKVFDRPKNCKGETWTCGIVPDSHMEYTAIGFSKPLRLAFRSILRPQHDVIVQKGENDYFGRTLSYQVRIKYVFSEVIYRPFNRFIINMAKFLKVLQAGSLQLYIGYILTVTIVILVLSIRW